MSIYENQVQARATYSDPEMPKTEENGTEILSSMASRSDLHAHEWTDVLKDLEPFY